MTETGIGGARSRLRVSRPAVPPVLVDRPRLDAALIAGIEGPIPVVCAGPGYGKTLAVAAWAEDAPWPVVWLTADPDADLPSFWIDMLAAFRVARVPGYDDGLDLIAPGPDFGLGDVDRISDVLAAGSTPVIVVIDDVHLITDPDVNESIIRLLDACEHRLRLILIGRTWPRLRLRRRQLDGAVTEITAEDLAFTSAETRQLCDGMGLSEAELGVLGERTQGWPAGLRLALLGRGSPVEVASRDALWQFSGHNRLVAAYLLEEVLAGLSSSDRRFLLATSLVPEVDASLAHALTGRDDGRRVLEQMVADNALTVRLADRPDWFRYHPLLRELLGDRLQTEVPDSVPELHRRAAHWYLDHGDHVAAVGHLIAADDRAQAARVLGGYAIPLMLTARAADLAATLQQVDDKPGLPATVAEQIIGVVLAYHRRDYLLMGQYADAVERMLADGAVHPDAELVSSARIVVAVARMVLARFHTIADLTVRAEQIRQVIGEVEPGHIPAAPAYLVLATNNLGIGNLLQGRLVEARGMLEGCRDQAVDQGMGLVAIAASGYLSLLDLIDGHLAEAGRRARATLEQAGRRGWSRQPQVLISHAVCIAAALHTGHLEEAWEHVRRARVAGEPVTDIAALMIVEIYAIWVAVAAGDADAARTAADRLAVLRSRAGALPDLLRRWMCVVLIRLHLVHGDVEGARESLPPMPQDWGLAGVLERVVTAEVALASAKPNDVAAILGPSTKYRDYPIQQCEAMVVAAVAAARCRRDAQALDRIGEAIAVAGTTGSVRPFAAWSADIGPIVARYRLLTGKHVEVVDRILELCGDGTAAASPPPADPDAVAPEQLLTERELAVLRYLPTMYKASEIAADLFVSVNTVKTHQQSIYRKLGVSTRRDAVDRARERRLL